MSMNNHTLRRLSETQREQSRRIAKIESAGKHAYLKSSYPTFWTAATTNPTLGNGTLTGYYETLSTRTVRAHIELTWGSTTSGGGGLWYFTLPFTATERLVSGSYGVIDNAGALTQFTGLYIDPTKTKVSPVYGVVSWTAGMKLVLEFTYEIVVESVTPSDTTAPTIPTGLVATSVTTNAIEFSWDTSIDDSGEPPSYRVSRDGVEIASTTLPHYADGTVSPSTAYSYTVSAVDGSGNQSAESAALNVTTAGSAPVDTSPPDVPVNVRALALSDTSIQVDWDAVADPGDLAGYQIFRGGSLLTTLAVTTYTNTGLAASTQYSYQVRSYDTNGNYSALSRVATAATPSTPVEPPPDPVLSGYFVSLTGRSTGAGTLADPWDIATAFNGGYPAGTIHAGDTIYLRGGTYGNSTTYTIKVRGEAGNPVKFSAYPGEHVKIDGALLGASPGYIDFACEFPEPTAFEIYDHGWATRDYYPDTETNPPGVDQGFYPNQGDGWMLTNLITHDGQGGIYSQQESNGIKFYGCITYNNGWQDAQNGVLNGRAHGGYFQNDYLTVHKTIEQCVFGIQFSYGAQVYGETPHKYSVDFKDCFFLNSTLYTDSEDGSTIDGCWFRSRNGIRALKSGVVKLNIKNSLFTQHENDGSQAPLQFGYYTSGTVTGNTIVSRYANAIELRTAAGQTWNNNAYYRAAAAPTFLRNGSALSFAAWKTATGYDAASICAAGLPAAPIVQIKLNTREAGRGHIHIYNPTLANSVNVDLSGLGYVDGDVIVIRNALDPFNATGHSTPITFTYNSASPAASTAVPIDMQAARWDFARPYLWDDATRAAAEAAHGDVWAKNAYKPWPEVGCFLVRKTYTGSGSGGSTPPPPPTNPDTVLVDMQISDYHDDGFYRSDGASFGYSTDYMYLGRYPDGAGGYIYYDGYLRFPLSAAIPQGALIEQAYIELTPQTTYSNYQLSLSVYGEDAAAPAYPTSAIDAQGRNLTDGGAGWNLTSWTAGTALQSPDLTALVQELVNARETSVLQFHIHHGAADNSFLKVGAEPSTGGPNAARPRLVLRYSTESSGSGTPTTVTGTISDYHDDGMYRTADSNFGNATNYAYVGRYPDGAGGYFYYDAFYRFTLDAAIPQGKTIQSALLTLTPLLTYSNYNLSFTVRAEVAAAPAYPTSAADADGRTKTTASATWNLTAWVTDEPITLDVTALITELVGSLTPTVITLYVMHGASDNSFLKVGAEPSSGGPNPKDATLSITYLA